jgi:transposase-like protein
MVMLVALGLWAHRTHEILDWQIVRREDHQEWEGLLQRLWERGCQLEHGEALALMYGTMGAE